MINRYYLNEIPVDSGPRTEVRRTVGDWLLSGGKPRQVVTLNAVMLTTALKQSRLKRVIQRADLVTVDGCGIMMALQRRVIRTERFPGVELAGQLMDFCIQEKCRFIVWRTKGLYQLRQIYGKHGSVFFGTVLVKIRIYQEENR